MAQFKYVEKYKDCGLPLPKRSTEYSAGYDLTVVEDTIVPTWTHNLIELVNARQDNDTISLEDLAKLTKSTKAKPTLVSTGVKCYLDPNSYLEISVRSSTPLKYWLVLANGKGIIDGDYVDNPSNEGEIFVQLINLSPYPIQLRKGDVIAQAIIHPYLTTADDKAEGERKGGFGSTSK